MDLWAVLRILLAVLVYFAAAALSVVVSRQLGADLKSMEGRASAAIQVVGIAANALVFGLVVVLLVFLDKRRPSALGIRFDLKDAGFLLSASAAAFGTALVFVAAAARVRQPRVHVRRTGIDGRKAVVLAAASVLLLTVALQEETLFRGYIGVNMAMTGPWVVLLVTSVIFTAIHFPTNVASPWQALGWFVSGLLLGASYLLSGSIWIAVGIHFVTDFLNVLVFNVAGKASMYEFEPPLTPAHRTLFRLLQGVVTVCLLILFYGTGFKAIG